MELIALIAVGVLFGAGIYLILQKSLLRVVLGTALVSHAVNLLLLTSGRLKRGSAPILEKGGGVHGTDGQGLHVPAPTETGALEGAAQAIGGVTDPLPQALILTAIVIGFATTALLLVIAYKTFEVHGTDDLDRLREAEHER